MTWEGITANQARTEFNKSRQHSESLIEQDDKKNGYFHLAKTCRNIIETGAIATQHMGTDYENWEELMAQVKVVGKNLILKAQKYITNWTAEDYEVAAVIICKTDGHNPEKVEYAIDLLVKGLNIAVDTDNFISHATITSQMVHAALLLDDISPLHVYVNDLSQCVFDIHKKLNINPETLSRLYLALSEGADALGIHYEKIAAVTKDQASIQ